jgi:hypothetical protein
MLAGAFDDDIRYQIKYIAVLYIREETVHFIRFVREGGVCHFIWNF